MTISEMLAQSGILTVLGMGVVFAFLIIMVIVITYAGKLINANSPDKDTTGLAVQTGSSVNEAGADNSSRVIAAISAAISEHRKTN